MSIKITPWTLLLVFCVPGIRVPAASGDEAVPGLLSSAPSGTPSALQPTPEEDTLRPSGGQAYNVVQFAAGTVEFAVPWHWTVKQVPLSREIRLVAGPGDVPDDPGRLERGLWLAYHRTPPAAAPTMQPMAAGVTMAAPPPRPALEVELRSRFAKAAGADARLVGPPEAIKVGGFAGLKQCLELAGSTDTGPPRRASYVVAQTTWGVFEMLAVAPLFAERDVAPSLAAAVNSLEFHVPRLLPEISAPEIADAQAILGSWKGQRGSLHLLPSGQARLDSDAVTTIVAGPQVITAAHGRAESFEGRFTARGDLLFITWDDGRKFNYRWRLERGELQLVDHESKFSRLWRLFDAPAAASGPPAPTTVVVAPLSEGKP